MILKNPIILILLPSLPFQFRSSGFAQFRLPFCIFVYPAPRRLTIAHEAKTWACEKVCFFFQKKVRFFRKKSLFFSNKRFVFFSEKSARFFRKKSLFFSNKRFVLFLRKKCVFFPKKIFCGFFQKTFVHFFGKSLFLSHF